MRAEESCKSIWISWDQQGASSMVWCSIYGPQQLSRWHSILHKKSLNTSSWKKVQYWFSTPFLLFLSPYFSSFGFLLLDNVFSFVFKDLWLSYSGFSSRQSQFLSAVGVGVTLGVVGNPISVIKVPLQAGITSDLTVLRLCRQVSSSPFYAYAENTFLVSWQTIKIFSLLIWWLCLCVGRGERRERRERREREGACHLT